MSTMIENIEQQCEDAIFEVCDARERYPQLCSDELARSLRIQSEIAMAPVAPRVVKTTETSFLKNESKMFLDTIGNESKNEASSNEESAEKWKILSNKVNDLKIIAEQINSEKYCEMNEILKDKSDDRKGDKK